MCGIWCYCCVDKTAKVSPQQMAIAKACVAAIEPRGPEETVMKYGKDNNWGFGFTRLAINGLKPGCGQPFTRSQQTLTWMCNGEIYNHKELEVRHGLDVLAGGSDCEVIGPLYKALNKDLVAWARALDGVFAIAIYDDETKTLVLARDPYGVRPLYYGFIGNTLYAASEIKALPPDVDHVSAFPPGHVATYSVNTIDLPRLRFQQYHVTPWIKNPSYADPKEAASSLRTSLEAAVNKRLMTERPIAALLSGGLDSSLIAALVQRSLKEQGRPPLETYSIGFPGSSDLKYARLVADHIGSTHHEIVSSPDEFFAAIPEVIRAIESPDITTVRASVGNWLVAKYIRENSPSGAKVVFNGDGSDEVFGSYLYFYNAPTDEAFETEVDRLLKDIHHFDVLRSDRSISSHGLEPRTPFLDKQFVAVARSIPTSLLRPSSSQPEKALLRSAFDSLTDPLLPQDVLWRRKEAFSDGVSGKEKAWYQEAQERIAQTTVMPSAPELSERFHHLTPTTLEAYYYRKIYDSFYEHLTIPYFWMPRWSEGATDPSARTLKVYGDCV